MAEPFNQKNQPQMPQAQAANKTVIIGCKLPNGIRLTVEGERGPEHIVLKGNANYYQRNPQRKFVAPDLVVGDSLTMVSSDFWDAWVSKHKDYEPYRKGMIYAAKDRDYAKGIATDTKEMKTGLEQCVPKNFGVAELNDDSNLPK